jgi:hypothetical protein
MHHQQQPVLLAAEREPTRQEQRRPIEHERLLEASCRARQLSSCFVIGQIAKIDMPERDSRHARA